LGLNGLESSIRALVTVPAFSALKNDLTRATVKPPITTTATIRSGNHALRTTFDICTYVGSFPHLRCATGDFVDRRDLHALGRRALGWSPMPALDSPVRWRPVLRSAEPSLSTATTA
jgi:hypothetical protein